MNLQPPAGSKISIVTDGTDPKIVIPCAGGPGRYFTGLFLQFWLGIWTVAFKDVGSKVISGNANGFMVFWLGGWVAGPWAESLRRSASIGPLDRRFPNRWS
jgi:hypothetical protein